MTRLVTDLGFTPFARYDIKSSVSADRRRLLRLFPPPRHVSSRYTLSLPTIGVPFNFQGEQPGTERDFKDCLDEGGGRLPGQGCRLPEIAEIICLAFFDAGNQEKKRNKRTTESVEHDPSLEQSPATTLKPRIGP